MGAERWRKVQLDTLRGDGTTVEGWARDGYEIHLGVNKGHEVKTGKRDRNGHYWWFEVAFAFKNELVGESPSLAGAKKLAREHKQRRAA